MNIIKTIIGYIQLAWHGNKKPEPKKMTIPQLVPDVFMNKDYAGIFFAVLLLASVIFIFLGLALMGVFCYLGIAPVV